MKKVLFFAAAAAIYAGSVSAATVTYSQINVDPTFQTYVTQLLSSDMKQFVSGSNLVANGGEVVLYYLGSEAVLTDALRIYNGNPAGDNIFWNKKFQADGAGWKSLPGDPQGYVANLGTYADGTILDFGLAVHEVNCAAYGCADNFNGNPAVTFHTGDGSKNWDNKPHVSLQPWTAKWGIPNGILVGFEDLSPINYPQYEDYNDHIFVFTNVRTDPPIPGSETPEPEQWAMMAAGLGLIVFGKRNVWFGR